MLEPGPGGRTRPWTHGGVESAVAHNAAGAKQTADSWMDARGGQEGGSAEHPGHRVRKTQTTPPNATAPTHPHRSVPRSKTHAQPPGPTTGQAKGPVCPGHRPGRSGNHPGRQRASPRTARAATSPTTAPFPKTGGPPVTPAGARPRPKRGGEWATPHAACPPVAPNQHAQPGLGARDDAMYVLGP